MRPEFLDKIQGPSRFLGSEVGAVRKDPGRVEAQVALLFPDHYDLGMSHLGFKIVYHALNEAPDLLCERAFCPEPGLEKEMRRLGQGLCALESGRPLREFDLIGLSLPHELAATNVLTLLDLAGVPLLAAERGEDEPIVLAGGPAAFNPEPLAPFLDAVLLGDGEEAAPEAARLVGRARREGLSRTEILDRLAQVEGIYVPSFFEPVEQDGRLVEVRRLTPGPARIAKRTLAELEGAFAPQAQLVAFGRPVHDRLQVELARGCTRGCRFCQAGVIYRPVREREPRSIYNLILSSLKKTGYDELSLLSLSAGDYSCLAGLLPALMARLSPERISVSLPSLRADSFSGELAELIRQVRLTGLTLAPEAGSERLRQVINKNLSQEQILSAAEQAGRAGWRLLKLYFMIGLPGETEADLEAILDLCQAISRRAPGLRLNVSISPFVPKAHTPFQWEAQTGLDESLERLAGLKRGLKRLRAVKVKWNSPWVAQLEGLLSRGDRRLGRVILRAWQKGARFEAWSEHFDLALWLEALREEGLSPEDYLAGRPLAAVLPWDHLSVADKGFLLLERERALAGVETPDCRQVGCQGCGVCDLERLKPVLAGGRAPLAEPPASGRRRPRRLTFSFHKLGPARFFGHLEMVSIFQRAFRRAGIRVGYSQGFNPQPRFSFFEALPVGSESLQEWVQVEVLDHRSPEQILKAVNQQLPEGLGLTVMAEGQARIRCSAALYRVSFDRGTAGEAAAAERIEAFLGQEAVPFERRRPGKVQSLDLRRPVAEFKLVHPGEVELVVGQVAEGPTPRPEEIVAHVLGLETAGVRVLKLKTVMEEA